MKTIPPPCPEPAGGRAYWRSLDELADTPEFRQWMEREFPAGASELKDPISRRHFVKIMSSSFLLAGFGLTGCRRPEEKIYPFPKAPEQYVHGQSQFFATAMPGRRAALPLLVKSHEGRPIKVEGNPDCPGHNGGTDTFAQASLLDLYDADRATRFRASGREVSRESAMDHLAQLAARLSETKGQGAWFLMEESSSPSLARIEGLLRQKFPEARWVSYEPVNLSPAFLEKARDRFYQLEKAKVIVSIDCDFIGSEEATWRNIAGFVDGRRLKAGQTPNRLYLVESLFTLTGVNADHRLRRTPSQVSAMAARLALEVIGAAGANAALPAALRGAAEKLAAPGGADTAWIKECAKDLLANRGSSLVLAGYRQPPVVHLLAQQLNAALGNAGQTVFYPETGGEPNRQTLTDLHQALTAGQVENLVVVGANPVYNAPGELDWRQTQRRARNIVRLAYHEDETAAVCDWHFPGAHYLESWGDARTVNGTVVSVQPLIEPLFGGLTALEFLARVGGLTPNAPYDIVRETFRGFASSGDPEANWRKFLHLGFWEGTQWPMSAAGAAAAEGGALGKALEKVQAPAAPSRNLLEVVFYRDYRVDDGRYNNNGWLQELPDPITKLTWDNAVLISRKTARELELRNEQVVEVTIGNRNIKGPVWIQPGMADYTIGLALGYGRDKTGRVGRGSGFNAYWLRNAVDEFISSGGRIRKTGERYPLSITQDHWSMEGRPIIREANFEQYQKQPNFAQAMNMEEPPSNEPLYPNPFDRIKAQGVHQWGMSIDLTACVGCSACMMACQSENNIPIVGKEQVALGREMHWIRIDRYYTGNPAVEKNQKRPTAPDAQQQAELWIDDAEAVTQPMLCQHCESAPCESVCPVNATVHDEEGLNVMVYNRCVGTRYCSNNCPYKVRRFNYFDYNKRPLNHLYLGPLARKPGDEYDLLTLAKNPDVTVRMRGVMEKCTYCIQRIEQAKIAQKIKAGASGDVEVRDGTFQTACQQACPARAIVFGNIKDPESAVSHAKSDSRTYKVLDFLRTKPRTTYLARVRNPNPAMPDYRKMPLSSEEFEEKSGGEPHESPEHHPGTPAAKEAVRG